MRPLTPSRFQALLATPTAYTRIVQVVASRPGLGTVDLSPYVSDATFTCDTRRSMRWSGSLTVELPDGSPLLPLDPQDLLTPFGTLLTVSLGVMRSDSSYSVVGFGVMEINSSNVTVAAGSRTVSMECVDMAHRMNLYLFETPLSVAGGDLADIVNAVVADRTGTSPGLGSVFVTAPDATFGLDPNTGPWDELQAFVTGYGFRIYYDRDGDLVLDRTPPAVGPATHELAGPTTVSGTFDRAGANVAVARSEPTDGSSPQQSVAMDSNPSSPTWAGTNPGDSAYGRVTTFFTTSLSLLLSELREAAAAVLAQSVGQASSWTIVRPFDPTLDPDDVVRASLDSGRTVDIMVDAVEVAVKGETTVVGRQVA